MAFAHTIHSSKLQRLMLRIAFTSALFFFFFSFNANSQTTLNPQTPEQALAAANQASLDAAKEADLAPEVAAKKEEYKRLFAIFSQTRTDEDYEKMHLAEMAYHKILYAQPNMVEAKNELARCRAAAQNN